MAAFLGLIQMLSAHSGVIKYASQADEEESLSVTKVREEVAWYLLHTMLSRLLSETLEARECELEDESCFGSMSTRSLSGDVGDSSSIFWQWTEDSYLLIIGHFGGSYPENLSEKQIADLKCLGWNVPENSTEEPCILIWDGKPSAFHDIANIMISTFRDIYGVKADWVWKIEPSEVVVDAWASRCDEILMMVPKLQSRNLEEVLAEELSFVDSFQTPGWLRSWT